MPAYPVLGRS